MILCELLLSSMGLEQINSKTYHNHATYCSGNHAPSLETSWTMFHSYHHQTIQYLSQLVPLAVEGVGVEEDHQVVVEEGVDEEFYVVAELQP